jgi:hypothetical protein
MIAPPRPHTRRPALSFAAAGAAAALVSAFAGCSEPAPLIPQGAWAIVFVDPGADCQIAGHNVSIGEVSADKRQTLVKDDAVEGSVTTSVVCSVVDNGGSFYFDAAQSNTSGNVLTLIVPELTADATKDAPSKGTVSYMSPNTATTFSSTECNFYFADGTAQGVKAGTVWLTFECPTIAAASDNVCQIQVAYAAFEQCASKADEE